MEKHLIKARMQQLRERRKITVQKRARLDGEVNRLDAQLARLKKKLEE